VRVSAVCACMRLRVRVQCAVAAEVMQQPNDEVGGGFVVLCVAEEVVGELSSGHFHSARWLVFVVDVVSAVGRVSL
jgi:hypothetical protein